MIFELFWVEPTLSLSRLIRAPGPLPHCSPKPYRLPDQCRLCLPQPRHRRLPSADSAPRCSSDPRHHSGACPPIAWCCPTRSRRSPVRPRYRWWRRINLTHVLLLPDAVLHGHVGALCGHDTAGGGGSTWPGRNRRSSSWRCATTWAVGRRRSRAPTARGNDVA